MFMVLRSLKMKRLFTLIFVSILTSQVHSASESDGTPRIPKTGTCPSGYFSSGKCCEAFRKETPHALPKIPGRACPSGYYASSMAFR
jgi:hypothetical protein